MNRCDLEVAQGASRQRASYTCLLTGRPCGLIPVTLRRMLFLPPIWIGWSAVVMLPLAKPISLVAWQYLRMLRPYVALGGMIFASVGFRSLLNVRSGSLLETAVALAVLFVPVALWIVLGRLLDAVEFVRLRDCNRFTGTVTIRFSTERLAQEARAVLVLSGVSAKSG
jgi:hypothetical protein